MVTYKVIFIGPTNAGKTSLFSMVQTSPTVGCSYNRMDRVMRDPVLGIDRLYKFNIWDTAGQERYHSLLSLYTRGVSGAVLCFDLSRTINESVDELSRFKSYIEDIPTIFLVGCKADLVLNPEDRLDRVRNRFHQNINGSMVTSAKTDRPGVDRMFIRFFESIVAADSFDPIKDAKRQSLIVDYTLEEMEKERKKSRRRWCSII